MLAVIQDDKSVEQAIYVAKKKAIIKRLKNQFKDEWDIVGSLSVTTKMPGFSIGLPASACITGSKLAHVEGSICRECYAKRAHYSYDVVQNALTRRLHSLNHPFWVPSMVTLIKAACEMIGEYYFRWHDSGDIMGVWHLKNIVEVCKLTPTISHWLPTRETKVIRDYEKMHKM